VCLWEFEETSSRGGGREEKLKRERDLGGLQ